MNYAVVMAGGTGKRLWPLSREKKPKQLLKLFDGKNLLQLCIERLTPLFDKERIIILTNAKFQKIVRENNPEIPPENIIAETQVRDTAPAIGLAAAVLTRIDPDPLMAVVTADQVISPVQIFRDTLAEALKFVHQNPRTLLTFGITPSYPCTQYGYIKFDEPVSAQDYAGKIHIVREFKEKPNEMTAKKYLKEKKYLWNSGMFVWKANTVLEKLFEFLPDSKKPLQKIKQAWSTSEQEKQLQKWFPQIPKISIDYAVMEKADSVKVIKLKCRWMDLGSLNALAQIIPSDRHNNIISAKLNQLLDSRGNIIVTEQDDHLIAAVGIENCVIAHSPDATLICKREDAHRLKELLQIIKEQKGDKFL